jgi:hypothetical protein
MWGFLLLIALATGAPTRSVAQQVPPRIQVRITLDQNAKSEPVTGRIFFIVSKQKDVEPRLGLSAYSLSVPFFGKDVESLRPGESVTITEADLGFPFQSLRDLPAGDYTVQALLNVYTKFTRADGHTIWAHNYQGEGQPLNKSPGNLISEPVRLRLNPAGGSDVTLKLVRAIPPIKLVPDTEYVKHLRFKSALASAFWGQDIYVGATIILPKGYSDRPEDRYPVVFEHGHSGQTSPFLYEGLDCLGPPCDELNAQSKAFRDAWSSGQMPRMILVSLQNPTPFYDTSYFVNSPNTGPWRDVFMQEVIPFIESRFRTIPHSYARQLVGISSGGWTAAALQIHHPDQFGGAWILAPDFIDFREYSSGVNLYSDDNAFQAPALSDWTELAPERPLYRTVKGQPILTIRQFAQATLALGGPGRSGEWFDGINANWGPTGADGYPRQVFDYGTGKIDREIVEYWRASGFDLREYLERNWHQIGTPLAGKLHFAAGDMDTFYPNLAMYRMEEFLRAAKNPPFKGDFRWGRPMIGHTWNGVGYDPWPMRLLQEIAAHIAKHTPVDTDSSRWHRP